MVKQMAKSTLTDDQILNVGNKSAKFETAALKAVDRREQQRIADRHAEATKDGSILGLKNPAEARLARKLADRPIQIIKLQEMADAGKIKQSTVNSVIALREAKQAKEGASEQAAAQ